MKKNLLLIALTISFISGEIKAAAEFDTPVLSSTADWVDEALARWSVTVDQLRTHLQYRAELARAKQMIDQDVENAPEPKHLNPYDTAY